MMTKQQVFYDNTSGRGRHSFFNFSEIWVKFLKKFKLKLSFVHMYLSVKCAAVLFWGGT